ncbi:hypothetical protein BJX65DRAFT_222563 [Aspergillus insuetus]
MLYFGLEDAAVLRRCRTSDRYTRRTPAKGICALVCGLTVSTKVGNETPKRHGVAQMRYPLKGMASRRNDKACVQCGDHPKYEKTVILFVVVRGSVADLR